MINEFFNCNKIKYKKLHLGIKRGRQIQKCPKSLGRPLERCIFECRYEITQTVYGFIEKSSSEINFSLR